MRILAIVHSEIYSCLVIIQFELQGVRGSVELQGTYKYVTQILTANIV